MKVIPLGLQCSVPEGIKQAGMREYSYPFDWLWTPSKTGFDIINTLLKDGIDKTIEYMTTGYTYYKYLGNEHYLSVDNITECQMNVNTGLGITHFTINDEYTSKLRRRLERLEHDIKTENCIFIYADAASPERNYHLDDVEYGLDANEYLSKIYELLLPHNKNIKMLYFCWKERKCDNKFIEYIPFQHADGLDKVTELVRAVLCENRSKIGDFTQFHH